MESYWRKVIGKNRQNLEGQYLLFTNHPTIRRKDMGCEDGKWRDCLSIVYNGGDEPPGSLTRLTYCKDYLVMNCLENLGFWTTGRTHEETSTLKQGEVGEMNVTCYSPATQITVIKLHNKELRNLFSSDIIWVIK
jgi:hypothetical protein